MKKYLVGELYDDVRENNKPSFQEPYLIIDARCAGEAKDIYNKITNANFFYGDIVAEIVDDKLCNLSKYMTVEEAEKIYNGLLNEKNK